MYSCIKLINESVTRVSNWTEALTYESGSFALPNMGLQCDKHL